MSENNKPLENENEGQKAFNDDFVIGEGFSISEVSYEPPKQDSKKRKKKAKNTVKSVIWVVSIILISTLLAGSVFLVGAEYLGLGIGRGQSCVIDIKPGASTTEIAQQLKEANAINSALVFRIYTKLKGYDGQYKYGLYTFNNDECAYEDLAQMLLNEGAKAETVTVTIPEGTGINDYTKNVNGEKVTVPGIATLLEKAGVCKRADFIDALNDYEFNSELLKSVNVGKTYYELEGYLFPETYDFYSYDSKACAKLAVQKMVEETEKRITDKMMKRADEMGYTINEILTMASIVQMESGQANGEMSNVAAVFYNRLKSSDFTTLGSSPTCYYGGSFRSDDGRYDTYKIKGLPPGPLCSPSISAINAALYPANKDGYFYFVTDKNGKFYFHKTSAEQDKTINSLQKQGLWIYEYFD